MSPVGRKQAAEAGSKNRMVFRSKPDGGRFSAGQGFVEYILVIALVAGVVAGALALTGISVRDLFEIAHGGLQAEISSDASDNPPDEAAEEITVRVVDAYGAGIPNLRVYAYNDRGRYQGQYARTDNSGTVHFGVDEGRYRFLAAYQRGWFWSETIGWPEQDQVEIQTGQGPFVVEVTDAAGLRIPHVRVYAFTGNGRYVGLSGRTGPDGMIRFNLAKGDYRFRADYLAGSYWSDVVVHPHVDQARVNTGQRPFKVAAVDALGVGIADVHVYAFRSNGSYTGISGRTGAEGTIVLDLADGSFKFRADYQAGQYWSGEHSSPDVSEASVNTGQRPFRVIVSDASGSGIPSRQVYAYREDGRYTGVGGCTGPDGVAILNLADGSYKFRADHQASRYWSDVVSSPDVSEASVNTGQRPFHVKVVDAAGVGVSNVRVYAFKGDDSYTGVSGQTGADGAATLNLASGDFRFRADYRSNQYWSELVSCGSGRADIRID